MDEGVEGEPNWDLSAQPAPDFDVDQRVNWRLSKTAIGKTPSQHADRGRFQGAILCLMRLKFLSV